ncbi:L-fucose mutarotase [Vibrio amylolyticus]|uniref:L-fucose mutarotase n=1 Tax=Vibrio amylolyticus TaxID=2847292 RepID=UPI00354FD10F
MLKGIHPALSPDLLKTLSQMGHGDEILLADAHFPAHSMGVPVIRCDGVNIDVLLKGILPLFQLDQYVEQPLAMMDATQGDALDPAVLDRYLSAMRSEQVSSDQVVNVERFAFYDRAKNCFAVVITGETAKYGNIILKKGVTEPK